MKKKPPTAVIVAAVALVAAFLYFRSRPVAAAPLPVPDVGASSWPTSPYYPGNTSGGGSVGVTGGDSTGSTPGVVAASGGSTTGIRSTSPPTRFPPTHNVGG